MDKKKWLYIGLIFLMLLPTVAAIWNFNKYYASFLSVQFIVIIAGTIFMIVFLIARIHDKPNISRSPKLAEIYFSSTSNFMFAIFAGFGIAFSILWGSLYTYAVSGDNLQQYKTTLKVQGIILLFFLICAGISVAISFLHPLTKEIKGD